MESDSSYMTRFLALREENELLRQSARSFGELAERLAKQLDEARRRSVPRIDESRHHTVDCCSSALGSLREHRAVSSGR
jgi:hypothetical protein